MTWTLHIQDGETRILLGEYVDKDSVLVAYNAVERGLNRADVVGDVHVAYEKVQDPLPTQVGSVIWITKAGDNPQSPPIKAMRRDEESAPWVLERRTRNGNFVLGDAQVTGWEPWTP